MKISENSAAHYLPYSLSRHPTLNAILKYKDHLSIRVIKRVCKIVFYFTLVDKNTVLEEIRKLKSNKAVQNTDITVKVFKYNAEFFAEYIYLQYNEAVRSSNFPNCFKFANITAAFKQNSRNQKNNYRPISILPLT